MLKMGNADKLSGWAENSMKVVKAHNDIMMIRMVILPGCTIYALCAGAAEGLVHLCAAAASLRLLQDPALPVYSNPAHSPQSLQAVHLHLLDFSRRAA